MLSPLLLSIDQGTTSSRAAIHDLAGHRLLTRSVLLESHYPANGWVEQSAEAIWHSQLQALLQLEQAMSPEQRRAVAACGITNQRETTVLWRRGSGEPLAPAIVWQDGRTAAICEEWKRAGLEPLLRARTGLLVDPYFSASKIAWLLREVPAVAAAAADGQLCFGTVDSWLLQKLSAGGRHATECSNASRTLLMDLEQLCWDPDLSAALGVPPSALPELLPSCTAFGTIADGLPFAGVPITAMLGDQQAATLGQGCLAAGEGKCTYGTGAFLVINTGAAIHRSDAGLLSTVGWSDASGRPTYCLEGSLFNAGTVIQWLRDGLGLIERSDQVNELAARCASSGGVMLVPAFTGWGTPHWDSEARGLLIGLTRDSGPAQIARAALEGIALAVATLVELAEEARGQPLLELAADGGAAAADLLLQAQADATGLPVLRRADLQSTSRGVALLAGVQAGVLPDLASWSRSAGEPAPQRFSPQIDGPSRQRWRSRWHSAVERSLHWHAQAASVGAAESN